MANMCENVEYSEYIHLISTSYMYIYKCNNKPKRINSLNVRYWPRINPLFIDIDLEIISYLL